MHYRQSICDTHRSIGYVSVCEQTLKTMDLFETIFDDIHGRYKLNAEAAEKTISSFCAKTNIHTHNIICFLVFHIFHSSSHFNAFHPLPFAVTLIRLVCPFLAASFLYRSFPFYSVFSVFSVLPSLLCMCQKQVCTQYAYDRCCFFKLPLYTCSQSLLRAPALHTANNQKQNQDSIQVSCTLTNVYGAS